MSLHGQGAAARFAEGPSSRAPRASAISRLVVTAIVVSALYVAAPAWAVVASRDHVRPAIRTANPAASCEPGELVVDWVRFDQRIANVESDGYGVAVAGDGAVYMASKIPTAGMPYLTKFGPGGRRDWGREVLEFRDEPTGPAIDSRDGAVYIAGADETARLEKHDAAGALLWSKELSDASARPQALGVGAGGTVFVAGYRLKDLAVESPDQAMFLAGFSPLGEELWSKVLGPYVSTKDFRLTHAGLYAVAPAADGSIYVAGSDGEKLALFRLAANGEQIWERLGEPGAAFGLASAPDGVYVTGELRDGRSRQALIARYGTTGQRKWVRYWTDSRRNRWAGDAIARATDGTVLVSVRVDRAGPLAKPDAIVARYDRKGNRLTFHVVKGESFNYPSGVAAGLTGGVFLGGYSYARHRHEIEGILTPADESAFLLKYKLCGRR